jgi:hypothetical protein
MIISLKAGYLLYLFHAGLKNQRIKPKDVRHFENTDNPQRCHVRLFRLFLSRRPADSERFYLKEKKGWKKEEIWYTGRPIGKNQLSRLISTICTAVGITGNKRNHSLKATCATRLYQANVDEQMIMERTGHRSLAGVRAYKRTSNVQIENSSALLGGSVIQEIAKVLRGSVPSVESVSINFNFKDCSVNIHNN